METMGGGGEGAPGGTSPSSPTSPSSSCMSCPKISGPEVIGVGRVVDSVGSKSTHRVAALMIKLYCCAVVQAIVLYTVFPRSAALNSRRPIVAPSCQTLNVIVAALK